MNSFRRVQMAVVVTSIRDTASIQNVSQRPNSEGATAETEQVDTIAWLKYLNHTRIQSLQIFGDSVTEHHPYDRHRPKCLCADSILIDDDLIGAIFRLRGHGLTNPPDIRTAETPAVIAGSVRTNDYVFMASGRFRIWCAVRSAGAAARGGGSHGAGHCVESWC
jgi:hypothetical protein